MTLIECVAVAQARAASRSALSPFNVADAVVVGNLSAEEVHRAWATFAADMLRFQTGPVEFAENFVDRLFERTGGFVPRLNL